VSLVQVLLDPIGSLPASVIVAVGSTLPLAWRRRRPVAAALAGSGLVDAVRTTAAGETPLAPSVLDRLVGHYVRRPPTTVGRPPQLEALSARELEVLRLIGAGRSNPEIADELVISLATVKSHVRHILAKLALRDRVQAVVLAHECGLAGAQ
jgi:DNA-binding NarL/FixJ family response regulator